MGGGGNALDGDAVIDNGGVFHRVVVDDGGLLVNIPDLGCRQTAMTQIAVVKVVHGNKCKVVGAQTKVEAHPHADPVEAPA